MKIKQFRYGDSNLAYLLWSGDSAAVIDGGAADEILAFIRANNLKLEYVLNTHEHWDHTPGNKTLLEGSDAEFLKPEQVCELKVLTVGNGQLEAFPTPGHTDDSIVFFTKIEKSDGQKVLSLITGDTLFNGTVGNCYTQNYEMYFESLKKVLRFPPETLIYAGHDIFDYTTGVMDRIDPDNPYLSGYKKLYNDDSLVTTLRQELQVNPFIRFDDDSLDSFRKGLGMPLDTSFQRFRAMMSVH